MSPTCTHCDTHVSTDYVRVFAPDDETVNCCPNCDDRTGGGMPDGDRWREQGNPGSGGDQ